MVICWGTRALAAARIYNNGCAGDLIVCQDLDEVVSAIQTGAGAPVIVVAFAVQLTVAALTRIDDAARSGKSWLGFLCGRDEAGLSFAVAKALRSPRAELTAVDLFDAPAHGSAENMRRLPPDVSGGLRRPALVKIIRSHGEGGHAKLGHTVICGLLDEEEFPGGAERGCTRSPRSCKRAEPMGAEVVFGNEVAAAVVFFLCCNGFSVAGELFPSQVSLALAFAEGTASAVIAPVRPLLAPDELLAQLQRMVSQGGPLGDIVGRLNQLCDRLGQPHAFVLHGDPSLVLPASGTGPDEPTDHEEPLDPIRTWLIRALQHASRARRLLRSLHAWSAGRSGDPFDRLTTDLDRVERLALNAFKWAEDEPTGDSRVRLMRNITVLRTMIAKWDRTASQLLLDHRETIDAYDVGHYDQLLIAVERGDVCARCGTPTEWHRFGHGEGPEQARIGVLCLVCGPVREHRASGPVLTMTAAQSIDHFLRLHATLSFDADMPPLLHGVHVHLRFFDKARDRCVHEESRTVAAEDQTIDFEIPLPADLSGDLHSVRLVATTGFDTAYARVRFGHVPPAPPQ
ncbi:hypothetical protein [Streptomyces sp. NPDC056661]|uniref:hypothetical protein n=1 Tax=Streptomyces sp. NPDC056661 TaxID=3345898 RepID=UPI0036C6CA77